MESISNIHYNKHLLHHSLLHRPSFSRPIISICIKTPLKTRTCLRVKASSDSSSLNPQNQHNKPLFETLKPLSSLIKTTCVTIFTTAIFFSRFNKPSLAASVTQPTVESTKESVNASAAEEKEKTLEDFLESHPGDVNALRSLMEVKIKNRKLQEAIEVIENLIQIEPSEKEWPLLKAHLQNYSGDVDLAKLGFEEIISKDPLLVEAYHGLVMTASQSESGDLSDVLKRIETAMEGCKKVKKNEDLRDFKLLVAQVRVIEGNYMDALKVYQDLVKEEPRDFRPYLCQGIIYTLLSKEDEAEKQFKKYRQLVPKEHPYAQYFDDNMLATKAFSQMAEKQRTRSKS